MSIPADVVLQKALASGYDAELKVASILLNSDWSVSQNVYYIDKDENKGREIDISATKGFQVVNSKPEVTFRIYLCIEVKKTKEPFIFFTNNKKRVDGSQGWGILNWKNRVDRYVLGYDEIERLRPMRLFPRYARSYISFKDGKDQQIKSGILSAFKGAIYQAEHCDEFYSDDSRDLCFFIPFVVVDGPIFECYFENDSPELQAKETDRVVYIQNYLSESYGRKSSSVNVVTIAAFEEVLRDYRDWGNDICSYMLENRDNYRGE